MKQLTKALVMMVTLAQLLCSCYTSKILNKEDAPITPDLLSTIEPKKRYVFTLKTGQTQTVYVTGIEGETITGYLEEHRKGKMTKINYSATFESIETYVDKIYVRKFNPYLTTGGIVVLTTLTIFLISYGAQEIVGAIF